MKNNKIVYKLTNEDVQIVALEEIQRKLSNKEIEKIKDVIAQKIDWYDVISQSICEEIVEKELLV
jgi:DNA replicative helicase MCM subunit Mcm2 (Cdc46/Mcm family)